MSRNRHNIWKKIIVVGVVCLFLANITFQGISYADIYKSALAVDALGDETKSAADEYRLGTLISDFVTALVADHPDDPSTVLEQLEVWVGSVPQISMVEPAADGDGYVFVLANGKRLHQRLPMFYMSGDEGSAGKDDAAGEGAEHSHIIQISKANYVLKDAPRTANSFVDDKLRTLSANSWHNRTAEIDLGGGYVLGVKFLKEGEDETELEDEAKMEEELRRKGLGVPIPLRAENGSHVFTHMGALTNAPSNVIAESQDRVHKYIAYVTKKEYFAYPEDINDLETMRECAMNSITQLAQMHRAGYVHTSLSPLSHHIATGRFWFWNTRPIGGILKPNAKVFFSNIRLKGLADFAHAHKVSHVDYLYHEIGQALSEWTIVMTYHAFKNIEGITNEQITDMLMDGFRQYLHIIGIDDSLIEKRDKLHNFVVLCIEELTQRDEISSQTDGNKPTLNELVNFVDGVMVSVAASDSCRALMGFSLKVENVAENSLDSPQAMKRMGDCLYVADAGEGKKCVVEVNTRTGEHRDLAKDSLDTPKAMDGKGEYLYIADEKKKCLVEIDVKNNKWRNLAVGSLDFPTDVKWDDEYIYVADAGEGKKCVVEVNTRTGEHRDLAKGSLGFPIQGGMEINGDYIYIADASKKCIVEISKKTGSYRNLAEDSLELPQAMKRLGDFLYVADAGEGKKCVVKVNTITERHRDLAKGSLGFPKAMEEDGEYIYVVDWAKQCLIRVNARDGTSKHLAEGSLGFPKVVVRDGKHFDVADESKKCVVRISVPESTDGDKEQESFPAIFVRHRQRIESIHTKHISRKPNLIARKSGIIVPRERFSGPDPEKEDYLKRLLEELPHETGKRGEIYIGDIVIAPMKLALELAKEPGRVILLNDQEPVPAECKAQRLVLKNDDFLYLEGAIALARAIYHKDTESIKAFYDLLAVSEGRDPDEFIKRGLSQGTWNITLPAVERELIERIDDLDKEAYLFLKAA